MTLRLLLAGFVILSVLNCIAAFILSEQDGVSPAPFFLGMANVVTALGILGLLVVGEGVLLP